MMKQLLITLLVLAIAMPAFSQDDEKKEPEYGWKNAAIGNLNFTQSAFDNWTAGGEDNWVWQLDLNGKFINDQAKTNWANTGKVSYGRTKIGDTEQRKAADEISLESVFTYKMSLYVNPYVAVSGLTQLTEGFNYGVDPLAENPISKFLNPGYFTESFGIGYQPMEEFKTRLGVAFKQTVTSDTAFSVIYGVVDEDTNEPKKLRNEVGMESVSDYERNITETIKYVFKLKAFTAFDGADNIDVDWDNIFAAQIAKYLAVSFNYKIFYDSDVSYKRQVKSVLAVGLTYNFL